MVAWGALIGAGASIIGNMMQGSSDRSMNRANNQTAMDINRSQIGLARELNQQSRLDDATLLQRRVKDAKEAGLHPLMAVGASPTSGPSYMMPDLKVPQRQRVTGMGDALSTIAPIIAGLDESKARTDVYRSEAELNRARRDQIWIDAANSAAARVGQRSNVVQDGNLQKATLTGPRGGKFDTSPSTTAERVEQEYGGVSGEIYGAYRLIQDALQHARDNPANPSTMHPRSHGSRESFGSRAKRNADKMYRQYREHFKGGRKFGRDNYWNR